MNSFKDLKVFYGDLHNHCAVSYAHGPLSAALENAKSQLDFCSVTGHADWPDMPEPDDRIAYIIDFHEKGFNKFRKAWEHYNSEVSKYSKEGEFIAYPGYEIHSCEDGDYTFVYKNIDEELILGEINKVKEKLKSSVGSDMIAFPHHIAYPHGSRGINWESYKEELSPLVEILSMHGMSENCDSPRPFLHSMGPIDWKGTVNHGLSKGLHFGFLGSTDHHSGHPGSYGHGKTAVWAKELSREGIWEALNARRTYALTGDKIVLEFSINGQPMGSALDNCEEHNLEIKIKANSAIDNIDIIKNNRLLERYTPKVEQELPSSEFSSEIYLEMGWGEKHKAHQWNGEIYLEKGNILDIESRFRGMEVVSPVEKDKGLKMPYRNGEYEKKDNNLVGFSVVSRGNPTNTTPATQGINLSANLNLDSIIHLNFKEEDGEKKYEVPVKRLLEGSYARNLGLIDSPAFRLHRLPLPSELNWGGSLSSNKESDSDFYYVRVRLKNNQYAISSPIFFS